MLAVIHRNAPPLGAGALPLAGPPLIVRQLQWLRGLGCEGVAIDIGQDERGREIWRRVAEQEVLARDAVLVRAAAPLSPRALAGEAGFPGGARFLAIPETVIGNADLASFHRRAPERGSRVGRLAPPQVAGLLPPAEVRLITPFDGPVLAEPLPGWGASIATPGAALQLAGEALLGRLPRAEGGRSPPLLLHAAEHSPGVWVARGGRIHKGAVVSPPVLVGADAIVCRGARIGPGAFIGPRAIIEPGTTVTRALVEADTVVGEGLSLREVIATPDGLLPLDGVGPLLPLGDPLLLTRRRNPLPAPADPLLRLPSWTLV